MGRQPGVLKKDPFVYLILFFLLASFSLSAAEDWRIRNSYHFVIRYKNSSYRFLDRLANKVEDSYRLITQDLGFLRDEPWVRDNRASIYVYDSHEEFLENSDMPSWSVGFARPQERSIYTYADSYDFLKYVLVHELTHLILREFIGNRAVIPMWFEEGVATYIERKKDVSQLDWKIRYFLKNNKMIDFATFLKIEQKDLSDERNPQDGLEGGSDVEAFYLQSFSMVNFLFEEFDRYKFVQLLRSIKKEGDFDRVFFKTYWSLRNAEGLEKKWREFYQ